MKFSLLPLLFLLVGCEKYYLSMHKENLSKEQLASTFVRSPDPRAEPPPRGEQLVVEWRLPRDEVEERLLLFVKILYRDYTEETKSYPINHRHGVFFIPLEGRRFDERGGFLTYKAEITTMEGRQIKEWQQQLWVQLLRVE